MTPADRKRAGYPSLQPRIARDLVGPAWFGDRLVFDVLALALPLALLGWFTFAAMGAA